MRCRGDLCAGRLFRIPPQNQDKYNSKHNDNQQQYHADDYLLSSVSLLAGYVS